MSSSILSKSPTPLHMSTSGISFIRASLYLSDRQPVTAKSAFCFFSFASSSMVSMDSSFAEFINPQVFTIKTSASFGF